MLWQWKEILGSSAHTGLTEIRWLDRKHGCLCMLIHSCIGFILFTWLGNSWKPDFAWWKDGGAGIATALREEMTGGFPRGAKGKQQWPSTPGEKALSKQTRRGYKLKATHIKCTRNPSFLWKKNPEVILYNPANLILKTNVLKKPELSFSWYPQSVYAVVGRLMHTKVEASRTWTNTDCCY